MSDTKTPARIRSRLTRRVIAPYVRITILLFVFLCYAKGSAQANVVINELLPKTDPVIHEWVELFNNGPEPVSLDRWRLENTAGEVRTFIFNASWVIAPRGFLTLSGSTTGIVFSMSGDTVRLLDEKMAVVDSQSYPSILGYNTTMGRSADGGGVWAICTAATYNTPNNCPEPSPTPTPQPTDTPLPTPIPSSTPTPTPIPLPTPTLPINSTPIASPPQTPLPDSDGISLATSDPMYLLSDTDGAFALRILGLVALAWGTIGVIAYLRRKRVDR